MMQFGYIYLSKGDAIIIYRVANSVFPKFFVIVLSWIILHGIVQNFARNILTLKGDIDMIFAGNRLDRGCCSHNFSEIFRKMPILSSSE